MTRLSGSRTVDVSEYRHRPAFFRAFNGAGRLLRGCGLNPVRLEEARLLAEARRATGLEDFGDTAFIEPLRLLLRSYESESDLNFVGRVATRSHLLQLLENRLRLTEDRRSDPGIAAQRIARPIFVTGLPRTGSTLLHGLLAQDAANRVPMTWEVMFSSPPPEQASFTTDPRIRKVDRLLSWVDRLAPRFKTIHPIGAALPQECIAITAHAFASIEFHTTHNVPSYQRWLDQDDQKRAYRYHRQVLQHLQRHCSAERWVLKAPAHLYGLGALFDTYPDARIVHTHRDPMKVVPSIASHGIVLRAAFSDRIDTTAIASMWAEWWAEGIRRAMRFREEAPAERFVDIKYLDLVRDPIAAVRQIYRQLEIPLTTEAEEAMRRFLALHPKDKHGTHRYSLEAFGLERAEEQRRYAGYCERFGVETERTDSGP